VGGYAVGVLAHYGVVDGFVQWGLAIAASALVALVIGAVSIRTSGVYFIMITLAFTQMLYYPLGISIRGVRRRRRHAALGEEPASPGLDLGDAKHLLLPLVLAFSSSFSFLVPPAWSTRALAW